MKFFHYVWHFIKNILWTLIILIIYFLLIGMIKNGGPVNYYHYLNARDWTVISAQLNILEPHTLTSIFYNVDDISGAMVPEGHTLSGDNLTGILVDSGNLEQETGINVYDPAFQEDFNNNLDEQTSGTTLETGSFGFVNTGI